VKIMTGLPGNWVLWGDDEAGGGDAVVVLGGGEVADVDAGLAQGVHQRVVGRDGGAVGGEDEALFVEADGLAADGDAVELEGRFADGVAGGGAGDQTLAET
jgi:hypothetical protein